MPKSPLKLLLLLLLIGSVVAFFELGGDQYTSLSYLQSQKQAFYAYYQAHPAITLALFAAVYIVSVTFSLPAVAPFLTLLAGMLFGLVTGTLIVSFSSTVGATGAFLVSRFIFRESVKKRFRRSLEKIDRGIKREGAFYLFALRLVPLFPFFAINMVMGLTAMRTLTYMLTSWVGMIPGTIAYVYAGTQLGKVESPADILSFNLLLAFSLLGILPLILKRLLDAIKRRKALGGYRKPKKFDYNLIVIGAGSAGLVSAYMGTTLKAKVALIEKHTMGGDCLNTGCVPSKALIHAARTMHCIRQGGNIGINAEAKANFKAVMRRVHHVIARIAPHDSVERYEKLGVECIAGEAAITDPWRIEVQGKTLTARRIIIATGATPTVPEIPGLKDATYFTSNTLWGLQELPEKLVILGGGPIGCELAQAFQRLGSDVTLIERGERLIKKDEPEAGALLQEHFTREGIEILLEHQAVRIAENTVICTHKGQEISVPYTHLLLALGRTPNVQGLGLETIRGMRLSRHGIPEINPQTLQTSIPTIYVAGDVAGSYQFTHTAAHHAVTAALNGLFGSIKTFHMDTRAIPWCTFTDPEIAHVGLTETDASDRGMDYEITTYTIDDLDRAIADDTAYGFVKIITEKGKDTILGVTIAGADAGNLITEFTLAMQHGLGLNKILNTIHIYPTMSEASKYTAGQWKRAHTPQKAMQWLEKFQTWMRG